MARGRTGLNARLRAQNAKALALEEQIGKPVRMRAQLAARAEPTLDLQHAVQVAEDHASDLSTWRRRKIPQLEPERSVVVEPAAPVGPRRPVGIRTTSRESLRQVDRRLGREILHAVPHRVHVKLFVANVANCC